MIDPDTSWRSKVAPDLARAFDDASETTLSALVEVELSRTKVGFAGDPRRGERLRPHFIESSGAASDEERLFALAAGALETITGRPPHPIRAAGAYVVDVTQRQAKQIAQLDYVRRLTLNRRLQ